MVTVRNEFATDDQHCVWMDAGLLAYRLCDRGQDCEHCPLDAALRGLAYQPPTCANDAVAGPIAHMVFPGDRLYSHTHTWLLPEPRSRTRVRLGIDAFAASIIGGLRGVCWAEDHLLHAEGCVCTLELDVGELPICTPFATESVRLNTRLGEDPSAVVGDPYGGGWLADLTLCQRMDGASLVNSAEARRRAYFDERRFRRLLAFELFESAESSVVETRGPIGPDLRRAVGSSRYQALVGELIR